MAFVETPRCPDSIALGASAGPSWMVQVASSLSGDEVRNASWSDARMRFSIALVAMLDTDRNALIAFLRAVAKGRLNGFRIKDWSDYQAWYTDSAAGLGICTLISGSTYQLYKRYTSGASTVDRIIQKLVTGAVAIKDASNVLLTVTTDYTIDMNTGIVTKVGALTPAKWEGQFDVPVRMDSDMASLRTLSKGLTDLAALELIEIRV